MIIGAHRSGTSATAHALRMLGLQLGHILDSHDEPRPLQKFHEKLLRDLGGAWFNPRPAIAAVSDPEGKIRVFRQLLEMVYARFAETFGYRKTPRGIYRLSMLKRGAVWGWKEPRTTLLAPAWLEMFPEAHIIHIVRHPLRVGRSIQAREMNFRAGGDAPNPALDDLTDCVRVAISYTEAGAALESIARNYLRVRFEDLQTGPRQTLERMAEFAGLEADRTTLDSAAGTITSDRTDGLTINASVAPLLDNALLRELGYT